MMTCDEVLAGYLDNLGRQFACDVQPNGRLSLVTPYVYPDHDNVEIFVREKQDGSVVVSDLGETLRRLDTVGMDVLDTPNLAYTARRIADGFSVKVFDGVILKEGPREAIGKLAFEVLSVCNAVGSLIYGSKAYKPVNFKEEVSTFLTNNHFHFERGALTHGRLSGTPYTVAFRVWVGGTKGALVEPLSPPKSSGARRKVNATYRMWSDIGGNKADHVSLLNDELIQFKEEDLNLLKTVSAVYRWERRDEFRSHLLQLGGQSPAAP